MDRYLFAIRFYGTFVAELKNAKLHAPKLATDLTGTMHDVFDIFSEIEIDEKCSLLKKVITKN